MPTNHAAVAALPIGADANKTLLRNVVTARMPYVLADADDVTDLVAVDPDTGSAIVDIVYLGRLFHYDATDVLTAHDGITCLVTSDGRRYKLSDGSDVFAYSVLDNEIATPPGAPTIGDAYLIAAGATDDWAGKTDYIGVYTRRGWEFIDYGIGRFIYVESVETYYHKDSGGAWVAGFGSQAFGANSVPLSAAINFGKRIIVENQTTNAPPGSPSIGDAYVIGSSPTGDWAGHAAEIAICEAGTTFTLYVPTNGWEVYDKARNSAFTFSGSAWVSSAGTVVGAKIQLTVTGGSSYRGTGGAYYVFSSSTPPSRVNQIHLHDDTPLTYAAKAAGNILLFTYRAYVNNPSASAVALFVDSVAAAIDWGGDLSTGENHMQISFRHVAPDTSSHTYEVGIMNSTTDTDNTGMSRRLFTVQEIIP